MSQRNRVAVLLVTHQRTAVCKVVGRGDKEQYAAFSFNAAGDLVQSTVTAVQEMFGVRVADRRIKILNQGKGMKISPAKGSRKIFLAVAILSKQETKLLLGSNFGANGAFDEVALGEVDSAVFADLPTFALSKYYWAELV
jgi:hypothetical protein